MLVVSRYTTNGNYPALAQKLRVSCDRFGLRHQVEPVEASGPWIEVERQKPLWVIQALFRARETVVWLDVDCEVVQLPTLLFGTSADFAAYNWAADPGNVIAASYDPRRLVVSGGVMLFGYTAPACELLMRWYAECTKPMDAESEPSTDPVLDRVYGRDRPPVNVLWLPREYNRMERHWPDVEPVINHDYCAGGHSVEVAL